eukprot:42170_1
MASDGKAIWDAYLKEYNTEPKGATQLQAYAKKTDGLDNITFKDAKAIYEANAGNGGASESKESESNPLFASLQKGGDITKGLKKVTRDMTNKDKKISGKIEEKAKPKTAAAKKKAAPKKVKPPAIRKQGFRIWVENYVEGIEEIKDAGIKNEVYICNCKNSGFKIDTKVKAVIVDSCEKVQVEISDVLTSVDMINTKRSTLYIKKVAPTINVDKCAGPRLVLFQEFLDTKPQIITSMTSDMNVSVPGKTADDDMKDIPVPYQFITTVDPETKELKTVAVEHAG